MEVSGSNPDVAIQLFFGVFFLRSKEEVLGKEERKMAKRREIEW